MFAIDKGEKVRGREVVVGAERDEVEEHFAPAPYISRFKLRPRTHSHVTRRVETRDVWASFGQSALFINGVHRSQLVRLRSALPMDMFARRPLHCVQETSSATTRCSQRGRFRTKAKYTFCPRRPPPLNVLASQHRLSLENNTTHVHSCLHLYLFLARQSLPQSECRRYHRSLLLMTRCARILSIVYSALIHCLCHQVPMLYVVRPISLHEATAPLQLTLHTRLSSMPS